MKKLIYTSFSPNTRFKDLLLNIGILFTPWAWKSGSYHEKVEKIFTDRFPSSKAFTLNYARSGMYVLFKSLGISNRSVMVQGYTCVVAVSPVKGSGAEVVYVDIDPKTGNLSVEDLKRKITNKTNVVMFQYTYGSSCGIEEVVKLCKEKNLFLVEDCTNTIFGKHKDKLIGSFGDASIFSFGRDKAVSGVDGGLILINNEKILQSFMKEYDKLRYPSLSWIAHELTYPILWFLIKRLFNIKIGKLIHLIFTRLGILTKATSESEKRCEVLESSVCLMPNCLAHLAYNQLKDIDEINNHRKKIVEIYKNELNGIKRLDLFDYENGNVLLRYSLKIKDERRNELVEYMRKRSVYLGDWYTTPIAPKEVDLNLAGYNPDVCSNSELVCKEIVNLPTHINISEKDAEFIANSIKDFYADKENIK
ncbi:MAG: DegT/DnrJ/EryC1/StrS family aminotransferase [Patescibacteria group bacterium]